MSKLFANPWVRLGGRALIAAIITAVTMIHATSDGTITWRAIAVGAGLAFCEVFTPLNAIVGVFKSTTVRPT